MKPINIIFTFLLFITSCSKKKEVINNKPQADFTYSDEMDYFLLKDNSVDADGDYLDYYWYSKPDSVKIKNPISSSAYFNLPLISEPSKLKVTLVVSDGQLSDSVTKEIELPEYSVVRTYGLGRNLSSEHSNNCNYDWYYSQSNTGTYSNNNCGPTTATMAIKWVNQDFDKNPEDARNTYRPIGGWWKTSDIINYLNLYSVNNKTISVSNINDIQSYINDGNIVILCLDHYYIRAEEKSTWHIDKYYSSSGIGSGHFIIVKGYKIVDNQTYYESYDSGGNGKKYSNGSFKGLDRYYRSQDLGRAVFNWWNYAIIVSKGEFKSSLKDVDIDKIIHQSGK